MAMQTADEDGQIVGINVTPLVDVCLVLVIIFMVTAPLLMESELKVQLPQAKTQEGKEEQHVTIILTPDGQMAVDEKKVKDLQELSRELKKKLAFSRDRLVVLKADRDSLHGKLTEIMARAKEAGAFSMTIATEQKK